MLTPGIPPRLRIRPVAGSADKKCICECAHDQPTPKKRLATALKRRFWMPEYSERWETREWSRTVSVTARRGDVEGGGDAGGVGGDSGGAGVDGGVGGSGGGDGGNEGGGGGEGGGGAGQVGIIGTEPSL